MREGEIVAFETLEGLKGLAGHRGRLGDVLERFMFPDTHEKLECYFQEFLP